jgi:hypothetical protein
MSENPVTRFAVKCDEDFRRGLLVRAFNSSGETADNSALLVHDFLTLFLVGEGPLDIEGHLPLRRADFIILSLKVFGKSTEDDRTSLGSVKSLGSFIADSSEFLSWVGKRTFPASDLLDRSSFVIATTSVNGEGFTVLSLHLLVLLSINLHVLTSHRVVMSLHFLRSGHLSLEPGVCLYLVEVVTFLRIFV